jgi:hypothetical protein
VSKGITTRLSILTFSRKATVLFESVDEQLEYMEDADLDVARADLLESVGRYADAADVHFSEGSCEPTPRVYFD